MKKKLETFIYPIIAACVCFAIGIVLFAVALALEWGTTFATLQLYAWLVLAAMCAVLSVVFKFYPFDGQTQETENRDDDKQLVLELQKTLGEMNETLKAIEPTIAHSNQMISELRTVIIGEEEYTKTEEEK